MIEIKTILRTIEGWAFVADMGFLRIIRCFIHVNTSKNVYLLNKNYICHDFGNLLVFPQNKSLPNCNLVRLFWEKSISQKSRWVLHFPRKKSWTIRKVLKVQLGHHDWLHVIVYTYLSLSRKWIGRHLIFRTFLRQVPY